MGSPIPTRADDETVLDMLADRKAGLGPAEIARARGLTREYVSTVTNRVRKADEKESRERKVDWAGAYW